MRTPHPGSVQCSSPRREGPTLWLCLTRFPERGGLTCLSEKYVTDVRVTLHDGTELSLASSLVSWGVDGANALTSLSFRSSHDRLSLSQARSALGKGPWPRGRLTPIRSRPDLVCATYFAAFAGEFRLEYEVVKNYR